MLYIDDLDRCTPRQVVQVLQAVHLLLALDLFVVVVGVDPRWLLHSLRDQYQTILQTTDDGSAAADDRDEPWRTTPHDYLEKIFNIRSSSPGSPPDGFETMIRKLTLDTPSAGHSPTRVTSGEGAEVAASPTSDAGSDRVAEPQREGDEPEHPVAPAGEQLRTTETTGGHTGATGPPEIAIDLTPLQDFEERFLAALAPLVPSPRAATRLLNIYRMLRSTADLSVAARFLGGESGHGGEFQAVALLLSVQTAAPTLLGPLLDAPADPRQHVVGGVRSRPIEGTWTELVRGLIPRFIEGTWQNDVSLASS